ncbi:MAG TPA: hypothetical protein VK509_12500 [Polyangiales bacterium]|nr:hypothetical protein [Polyangiales bacterium]
MNDRDDPTRWAHGAPDAPSDFEALLRADERVAPSAAQLARVLDGLAAQLPALSTLRSPAAPAATAAVVHKGLLPLIFGALALLGIAGAVLLLRAPASPVQPAAPATAPTITPPAAESPPARVAPAAPAAEPASTAPAARANAARASAARSPASSVQPVRASALGASEDPMAELTLLELAQRVLRRDPEEALALAESHRARFERGALAQEREMIAIEALLRLKRRAQAERRARAFTQRYPQSSHGPRLRDLLRSSP